MRKGVENLGELTDDWAGLCLSKWYDLERGGRMETVPYEIFYCNIGGFLEGANWAITTLALPPINYLEKTLGNLSQTYPVSK